MTQVDVNSEDNPLQGSQRSGGGGSRRGSAVGALNQDGPSLQLHQFDGEEEATTAARGCNLVHPFTLQKLGINWEKESSVFSYMSWMFSESTIKQIEFSRFQFRTLVVLMWYIVLIFSDFVYPAVFFPETDSRELGAGISNLFGVIMIMFLILDVFAHTAKSNAKSSTNWRTVRKIGQVFFLVNMWELSGPFQFFNTYVACSHYNEFTNPILNREDFGWSPRRAALYCRSILSPYVMLSLMLAPASTSLPPRAIIIHAILRVILELLNRPLTAAAPNPSATGPQYGVGDVPAESAAELAVKLIVISFAAGVGVIVVHLRAKMVKRQFDQTVQLEVDTQAAVKKEDHTDLLLCATVPVTVLARLAANQPCSDYANAATVLFSDMVHFTAWSANRSSNEVIGMLNSVTEAIDLEAVKMRVEKIKTIGDAYWAVTGLPELMLDHAIVMCRFGHALIRAVQGRVKENPTWNHGGGSGVRFRVGIHSGPLDGGVLGTKMISYEVFGATNDVAGRIEQVGKPNAVVISEFTAHAAGIRVDSLATHTSIEHDGRTYATFLLSEKDLRINEGQKRGSIVEGSPMVMHGAGSSGHGSASHGAGSSRNSQEPSLISPNGSAHGDSSSGVSGSPNQAAKVDKRSGKQRRQAFLQQRLEAQTKKREAQAGADMGSSMNRSYTSSTSSFSTMSEAGVEDTAEEIREHCTIRKWSCFLYNFENPGMEMKYQFFALEELRQLRMWSRLLFMTLPGLVLFCVVAFAGGANSVADPSPGFLICYVLAIATAALDLGVLYHYEYRARSSLSGGGNTNARPYVRRQALLSHVTSILLLVGAMLNNPGSSPLTNDPSWLVGVCGFFNLFSNYGVIAALYLALANIFIIQPLSNVVCWHTYFFGIHRFLDIQVIICATFLLVAFERQLRQQFLEAKLQQHFRREQYRRVAEQDALLQSIVPEHISGALLTWMSGDMKTPLVRNYSLCAVAFLTLLPPTVMRPAHRPPGQAQGSPFSYEELDKQLNDDGDDEPLVQVTAPIEHWLADSMTQVDLILSSHFQSVSKIKTMGDVVMLGGPFNVVNHHPTTSNGETNDAKDASPEVVTTAATDSTKKKKKKKEFESILDVSLNEEDLEPVVIQLVQLAQALADVTGGVHAGVHVGPLTGAIQGTSRLCFDVFGDTVNIASRVMTGCAAKRAADASHGASGVELRSDPGSPAATPQKMSSAGAENGSTSKLCSNSTSHRASPVDNAVIDLDEKKDVQPETNGLKIGTSPKMIPTQLQEGPRSPRQQQQQNGAGESPAESPAVLSNPTVAASSSFVAISDAAKDILLKAIPRREEQQTQTNPLAQTTPMPELELVQVAAKGKGVMTVHLVKTQM